MIKLGEATLWYTSDNHVVFLGVGDIEYESYICYFLLLLFLLNYFSGWHSYGCCLHIYSLSVRVQISHQDVHA